MIKLIKSVWTAVLLLTLFCLGVVIADKLTLQDSLIRFHVVANSDAQADQQMKLSVRDSVTEYLQNNTPYLENAQQAKQYLQTQIPDLERIANETLQNAGSDHAASVTLTREEFGIRNYDTFSLPSGVYESLRIEIGSAKGKNWWCVVFPSLCLPATNKEFKDSAVSSGFEQGLVNTLSGDNGYEVRFFFLDCLGKIENFFTFG